MKKLFSLFLALCMAFSLASCVSKIETSTVSSVELVENDLDNVGAVTEAVAEETEAPAPVKAYPDNILMSDRTDVSTACVLGNENLKRRDVATVTFLDTLEHMPSNAWDVSDAKNGSVMAWYDAGMNLYIAGEGGVTAKDCVYLFCRYSNVTSIDFGGCFYTDISHDIAGTFTYCEKLETLDLSGWNVSGAEHLGELFYQCRKLRSVNLDGWDTSGAYSMGGMFDGCKSLEKVDISHFNTSNVTSLKSMFYGCENLTSVGDLSGWDTSNVKSFALMFDSCNNLTSVGDLSGWNTSSAKSMYGMFEFCKNLANVGDLKIPEGCDTTDMYRGTPFAK